MKDRHPVSGRKLPSALESVTASSDDLAEAKKTLETYEAAGEVEYTPWLVYGSWTIYSDDTPPTDAGLAALIVALTELAKLSALEAARGTKRPARMLKAPAIFHELWGQAKDSPTYHKQKWLDFELYLLSADALKAENETLEARLAARAKPELEKEES